MNKAEIKQIILEEIESAVKEIAGGINIGGTFEEDDDSIKSPEELAADTFFDDEGLYEEEEAPGKQGRTYNVFDISQEKAAELAPGFANMSDQEKKAVIGRFMLRVNNLLNTYRPVSKETGQQSRRLKKRFTTNDLVNLLNVFNEGSFKSSDILNAISDFKHPPQANKFLKALEMKGYIVLTSGGKKEKSSSTYVPKTDRPKGTFTMKDLGLDENTTQMSSNLEKYIRQQIREAKNPLAKKMKEIEQQGRAAALETKLAAIAEMIEETNARLTRIDEDEEFTEMMDKNAVKEVRKQLKELEKTKAKLEKEKAKVEGKMSKADSPKQDKEVVDEMAPEDDIALAGDIEDELSDIPENPTDPMDHPAAAAFTEEETFELSESVKRMQKLAGVIKG
jgi:hypothetical protein